jgi:hypothetical protein
MVTFSVSYSIVTEESAEAGEFAESGMLGEGLSLREAVDLVRQSRTRHAAGVECIESNEWPMRSPRWVSVINGVEFETGASETRALHMPESISDASRRRIARLVGVRG